MDIIRKRFVALKLNIDRTVREHETINNVLKNWAALISYYKVSTDSRLSEIVFRK